MAYNEDYQKKGKVRVGERSNMYEWERKFDAIALEKGKKLCAERKVQDVQKTDATITASLQGIHSYDVTITLRSGKPIRMKCQCPKARGGRFCEHMAAVLYTVYGDDQESDLSEEISVPKKSRAAAIRDLAIEKSKEKAEKYKTVQQDEEMQQEAIKQEAARQEAARQEAARQEAIRLEEAAEERAEKARQEAARRIEKRNAEKAAKKAERKRRRLEADKAARKLAEEAALKREEEERKQQEEARRKALEEEERRRMEEAAREKEEKERARKKAEKVKAAILREKARQEEETGKAAEEAERAAARAAIAADKGDGYNYFDFAKIQSALQLSSKNIAAGKRLSEEGKVWIEQFLTRYGMYDDGLTVEVWGAGLDKEHAFKIRIIFSRARLIYVLCGCPGCMKASYWSPEKTNCAYIAGLFLQAVENIRVNRIGDTTDSIGMGVLSAFHRKQEVQVISEGFGQKESLILVPRLQKAGDRLLLSFRIGSQKMFVIKDFFEFCSHVEKSETAVYGMKTEFNHNLSNFTSRGQVWYSYIHKVIQEEEQLENRLEAAGWYYSKTAGKRGVLELYGWRLDQFYQMLGEDSVEYEERDSSKKIRKMLTCRECNPRISMQICKTAEPGTGVFHGIDVRSNVPEFFNGLETAYFVDNEFLCKAGREFMERIQVLADLSKSGELEFRIGRNNLSEFYYTVLPTLQEMIDVTETDSQEIHSYLSPEALFIFYLDAGEHNITCRLHAKYGEQEVSVLDILDSSGFKILERFRMKHREEEILHITRQMFPELDMEQDELHCGHDEERMYYVLERGTEVLMEYGEVKCTQKFLNMNVISRVKVSIGVSVASDLLDLEITTQDVTKEELIDILKSCRARKKFFRLKNGDFMNLEDQSLDVLGELMDTMHLSPKEFVKGKLQLPIYRSLYLDKLLEENANIYNTRDSHFREIIKSFKTVNDADYEEPAALAGIMRGYQKMGFRWLRTLESCSFGGILADDMGLGKTLQAIAVLLSAKEEQKEGTSLIVSPASLVFNWGEELSRFAPQLQVLLVTGTQEGRQQKLEEYQSYDVLVTSYDLLKRDIACYEGKQFLYEVIDEAQYIKNHTTAAAKAVKVIQSRTRFALTGTPIENRLSELWSIFDYLMPGFLYSYEVFKRKLELPIVKNNDETALDRLQRMVGAFILRRLKSDVLKDLPDKLEEIRYVKMDDSQQKLYDAQVVHMQMKIAGQDNEEFNKSKMQIFAELMRLRQICCDPALCFENYAGESAKLESSLELIESAIDGGHKILLFSQFTSMLDILKKRLEKLKINFYVITGDTSKEKRLKLVKEFNEDNTPVFLISLKAGGVGLNLTGADVVIHYDPWWNLAVQNQATDRAHRIGQTKKVTVYKLIVKNSIEEKIQKLQEAKRDLADQIVNAQAGQLSGMSREDLLQLLQV